MSRTILIMKQRTSSLWASALIVLLACATGCTSLSSLQASHEKPASLDHTIIVMGHGISYLGE